MTHAVTTTSQLARFAECIFERNDIVEIRRLSSGVSSWHVATELPELLAQLKADNVKGQDIHAGVNPRRQCVVPGRVALCYNFTSHAM